MFIDNKDWEQKKDGQEGDHREEHRKRLMFLGIFSAVLVVIIVIVFFLIQNFSPSDPGKGREGNTTPTSSPASTSTPTSSQRGELPIRGDNKDGRLGNMTGSITFEAEKLEYGDFYKEPSYDISATSAVNYELPLQVKTDVSNYYDVNRKINLEKEVEHLNKNGFAVISNPYSSQHNNFYSVYKKLSQEEVPLLITSDFLQYYYQNIVKRNFKRIESNIFYNNLWNINEALYKKAKIRYERLRESEGVSSDPYLQAARMEVAFFATALKLLEPEQNQITSSKLTDKTKFSRDEYTEFNIELPGYLRDDVPREVDLILDSSKREARSPVLFYNKNYRQFRVPKNYQDNARLHNFYLASKWLNSVFPLYYKTDKCSECKLDKADWRISMIAAYLMSKDFADEQDIKNEWAQIYKVISYFRGLRDELTYLDYVSSLHRTLGDDYDLKETFLDKELEDIDEKLLSLRKDLVSNFSFSGLEGAHDHTSTSTKKKVGFRVLSQPYTPNEYIFKSLMYPHVGAYKIQRKPYPVTSCERDHTQVRCKGISQDVVNLVYSLPMEKDTFFGRNTNYRNYSQQVNALKEQLSEFDDYTWHGNNYWGIMDMIDNSLEHTPEKISVFRSKEWRERNMDFFLGSLVNAQVSADKININESGQKEELSTSLGGSNSTLEKYSYIEPNLVMVREMRANISMLAQMLEELNISEQVSSVKSNLEKVEKDMKQIESIVEKQLNDKELTQKESDFILNFATRYEVIDDRRKDIKYDHALRENIKGLDLLFFVYKKNGKKVMSVGPIFDYEQR